MSENFVLSLEIMGKGMSGVFAAALIIWFAVWIMQKIAGRKKKAERDMTQKAKDLSSMKRESVTG